MNKHVIVLICFVLIELLNAQTQDTIEIRQSFFGKKFYYNDNPIKKNFEFESVFSSSDSAMVYYKKAKNYYWFSQILSLIGGIFIGLPVGYVITGNDAPWGLAAVGAGFFASGFSFSLAYNNRMQKAVEAFNSGEVSMNLPVKFRVSIALNY